MNLFRALGVGALSLLAIGGWRYLGSLQRKSQLPSKEETLTILETIRLEFYPVLVKIADYVARELIPKGVAPDETEEYVLKNSDFKAEIERVNEKIYTKYSEEDVREATDKLYKEDGDIMKQKHEFQEEYKKALMGVRPEQQMIASRKISKSKLLEVIKELLDDKIARLQTLKITEMQEHNQHLLLQGDVEQDQRVTKQKLKQKLGLSARDSISIFHFATAKYCKEDPSFQTDYAQILASYTQKVRNLLPPTL